MAYVIRHEAGRLFEVVIASPVTIEEAGRWDAEFGALVRSLDAKYACLVDLRGCEVFPPEVSDQFLATMRSDNPHLLRTAVLLPESPLLSLQIQRMIREAGLPDRRAFARPDPLLAWMNEVLTPLEASRLRHAVSAPPLR